MSIYSDEFKAVLLKEELKENPQYTIANISDALCQDRMEQYVIKKSIEIYMKEKQGS